MEPTGPHWPSSIMPGSVSFIRSDSRQACFKVTDCRSDIVRSNVSVEVNSLVGHKSSRDENCLSLGYIFVSPPLSLYPSLSTQPSLSVPSSRKSLSQRLMTFLSTTKHSPCSVIFNRITIRTMDLQGLDYCECKWHQLSSNYSSRGFGMNQK